MLIKPFDLRRRERKYNNFIQYLKMIGYKFINERYQKLSDHVAS